MRGSIGITAVPRRWHARALLDGHRAGCGEDTNEPTHPSPPIGIYSYDIDEHVATGGWGPAISLPPFPSSHLTIYKATPDSLIIRWDVLPAESYPDTVQVARFVDGKYRVAMSVPSSWSGEHRFWLEGDVVKCEAVFTAPAGLLTPCLFKRVSDL